VTKAKDSEGRSPTLAPHPSRPGSMVAFVGLPALLILLTLVSVPLRVFPVRPNAFSDTEPVQASVSPSAECVRVGGPVREPRRIEGSPFRVPSSVRGLRTAGGVLLYETRIAESGSVQDVRLLRPLPSDPGYVEIDRAFRQTIRTWRYSTTVVSGRPVSVCLTVSVIVDVR
jgi:hypothetical protein